MKYKFEGIGTLIANVIAGSLGPSSLTWFKGNFFGRIAFWLLKQFGMYLADKGLVVLNVGVSAVQAYEAKQDFDGTLESAIKLVTEHGDMTEQEKADVDNKVIQAFDKFTDFGRQFNSSTSKS